MNRYFNSYVLLFVLLAATVSITTCGSDDPPSAGSIVSSALKTGVAASGFDRPLYLTFPPGDSTRLFVVEKGGTIRIFDTDSVYSRPFLDITDSIGPGGSGGEQGLLGMAFHPDYQANGQFFVNYTAGSNGATHVSRFSVSSDPNVADRSSESLLLNINQPYSNHNAGQLAFGPDGYLYVGTGDGGSANDPQNRAQNPSEWLGKMMRIDVDSGNPYAIPPDNPFIDSSNYRPEIWAIGLRNPWRYCFDRLTGELYIADVGQNEWEEIDYQPAGSNGGENYGWRRKEGNECFNPSSNCDLPGMIDPIHVYRHGSPGFHCSITGGYVYRGNHLTEWQGRYFFGDYCSGAVWSLKYSPAAGISELTNHTESLSPGSGQLVSFGEDYHGELYMLAMVSGSVLKIVAADSGKAGN